MWVRSAGKTVSSFSIYAAYTAMFINMYTLCITSARCTRGVCAIAEGDDSRLHCCHQSLVSIFTLMKPMKLCIILMGPWQKCRRHRRRHRRGRKLHFSATLKWGRRQRQLMSNALNEFWELPPFSLASPDFPVRLDTKKKANYNKIFAFYERISKM